MEEFLTRDLSTMGLISPLYRLLNRVTPEHCTIFPPVARPREDVLTFVPPRCIYVTISSRATKSVHPAVVLRRTHIAHAQYQPYPHSVQNKKATLREKSVRRCSWYKRERDEKEGSSTYFLPRFYSIQYGLHFFTCKYLIT